MVLKLVFDFVLCKEKLQPALVAVIYIPLLKGEKEKDSNKPLPLECSSLRRQANAKPSVLPALPLTT